MTSSSTQSSRTCSRSIQASLPSARTARSSATRSSSWCSTDRRRILRSSTPRKATRASCSTRRRSPRSMPRAPSSHPLLRPQASATWTRAVLSPWTTWATQPLACCGAAHFCDDPAAEAGVLRSPPRARDAGATDGDSTPALCARGPRMRTGRCGSMRALPYWKLPLHCVLLGHGARACALRACVRMSARRAHGSLPVLYGQSRMMSMCGGKELGLASGEIDESSSTPLWRGCRGMWSLSEVPRSPSGVQVCAVQSSVLGVLASRIGT
mmetsp:Transcript_46269/g.121359  ORF Transcript_46269/g.121359 Transcript_46269/m.121359 type:complete len:268 (-) Transcript_46269:74-877(-)